MPSIAADVALSCAERSGLSAFPSLTVQQIRFRTDRLGRLFALSTEEIADLRQEIAAEITRAMRRFNPAIASQTTYCKGVMNLWYGNKCKQLRREAKWRARLEPLPPFGSESAEYVERRRSAASEVDLRLDIESAIARLPGELLPVARDLLCGKSIPEIAAARGVHRGTVNRIVLQLRVYLADLDPHSN